ncbi:MAG TPA: hypothetical protein VFE46_02005 [Pirellulales bacterium]|nr:hypothetical protein [Pirellulales bacterium]
MKTNHDPRNQKRNGNQNVQSCHADTENCLAQPTCRLPDIPKNRSPVPELTSLHTKAGRGNYGDASYRGNCSGLLIRDLLRYYQPKAVLDPMAGSGTCRDVCAELGISCQSFDLKAGLDATDPANFQTFGPFDFVWMHPPYWRMVSYSDDPRCLSRAPTVSEFLQRLRQVIRNCLHCLTPSGRLTILMGDWRHQGRYLGLPFRTFNCAVAEGLWLDAPEIIRFQHGATSSGKVYDFAFIPRLHDVCLVFKRRPPNDAELPIVASIAKAA